MPTHMKYPVSPNRSRTLAVGLLVLGAALLSGCISHYTIKEHVTVCYGQASPFERKIGEKTVKFRFEPEINNTYDPIDEKVFWVAISGWNVERKSYQAQHGGGYKWSEGTEGIPMLYSTDLAYMESDDGTVVRADPGLYFSDTQDPDKPGRWIKNGIVDINSDDIQLTKKRGNYIYSSIYMRFNMPPPKPQAQWKIHLGRIFVDGQAVDIPPKSLCTIKGSSGWYRKGLN
jgi:hypothetical protein